MATRVSWSFEEMIISLVTSESFRRGPAAEYVGPNFSSGDAQAALAELKFGPTYGQLVKRRMRTLRISPKPASVAMSELPP